MPDQISKPTGHAARVNEHQQVTDGWWQMQGVCHCGFATPVHTARDRDACWLAAHDGVREHVLVQTDADEQAAS